MIRRLTAIAFLAAAAILATAAASSDIWRRKPAGLVAGWDFSGGRIDSPAGDAGTAFGGAAVAAGTRVLELDGVDDYISYPSVPNLEPPFSVSVWFKPDAAQTQRASIIAKNLSTGYTGWFVHQAGTSANRIYWIVGQDGGKYRGVLTADGTLTPGVWSHIVGISISYTSVSLYVDGAFYSGANYTAGTPTTIATTDPLRISAKTSGNQTDSFIKGAVGEVRIYNRELTAAEISQIYNAGAARIANGGTP